MADDLNLQVVIQAILDAKGFDEAKAGLKGLADNANAVGPATAAFAEGQRVSAREVRLATAEVLRFSGVTQEAGLIGRLAGVGFRALGDSAEYANLAIVGATLGLSIIIPLFLQWIGSAKDAAEKQKALVDELLRFRSEIDQYVIKVPGAERAAREWAAALKELALAQQQLRIIELEKQLDELKKQQEAGVGLWERTKMSLAGLLPGIGSYNDLLAASKARAAETSAAVAALTKEIEVMKLAASHKEPIEDFFKAGETGAEKAKKANQDRANFDLRATLDMISYGQKEEATRKKQIADENKLFIDQETERERLEAEARRRAEETAKHKAVLEEETLRAGATALRDFFGKSKAAAIAGAVADTYAAAAKAYARAGGGPWGVPIVAFTIVEGLAQVAKIEKAGLGFDNPESDALARARGTKWADDLLNLLDSGFNDRLRSASPFGGGGGIINQSTTINRGISIGSVNMGNLYGEHEDVALKRLNRKLIEIQRLENRTTVGGT